MGLVWFEWFKSNLGDKWLINKSGRSSCNQNNL